jgi:hypothetical protein
MLDDNRDLHYCGLYNTPKSRREIMSRLFSNSIITHQQRTIEIAKDIIERIFATNEDINESENQISFHYDPKNSAIFISKGLGAEYDSCLGIIDNLKDRNELLCTLSEWKAEAVSKELEKTYDAL